jgi:hypothetical protein
LRQTKLVPGTRVAQPIRFDGPVGAGPDAVTHRDRASALPTDVPGAELCSNDITAMSALGTTPTPGNRRAQPSKALFPARKEAADRPPGTVIALPVAFADRAGRASLGAEGDQKAGATSHGLGHNNGSGIDPITVTGYTD